MKLITEDHVYVAQTLPKRTLALLKLQRVSPVFYRQNKSVFSFLHQHCLHSLTASYCCTAAKRPVAIDQYFLPAGLSAANRSGGVRQANADTSDSVTTHKNGHSLGLLFLIFHMTMCC